MEKDGKIDIQKNSSGELFLQEKNKIIKEAENQRRILNYEIERLNEIRKARDENTWFLSNAIDKIVSDWWDDIYKWMVLDVKNDLEKHITNLKKFIENLDSSDESWELINILKDLQDLKNRLDNNPEEFTDVKFLEALKTSWHYMKEEWYKNLYMWPIWIVEWVWESVISFAKTALDFSKYIGSAVLYKLGFSDGKFYKEVNEQLVQLWEVVKDLDIWIVKEAIAYEWKKIKNLPSEEQWHAIWKLAWNVIWTLLTFKWVAMTPQVMSKLKAAASTTSWIKKIWVRTVQAWIITAYWPAEYAIWSAINKIIKPLSEVLRGTKSLDFKIWKIDNAIKELENLKAWRTWEELKNIENSIKSLNKQKNLLTKKRDALHVRQDIANWNETTSNLVRKNNLDDELIISLKNDFKWQKKVLNNIKNNLDPSDPASKYVLDGIEKFSKKDNYNDFLILVSQWRILLSKNGKNVDFLTSILPKNWIISKTAEKSMNVVKSTGKKVEQAYNWWKWGVIKIKNGYDWLKNKFLNPNVLKVYNFMIETPVKLPYYSWKWISKIVKFWWKIENSKPIVVFKNKFNSNFFKSQSYEFYENLPYFLRKSKVINSTWSVALVFEKDMMYIFETKWVEDFVTYIDDDSNQLFYDKWDSSLESINSENISKNWDWKASEPKQSFGEKTLNLEPENIQEIWEQKVENISETQEIWQTINKFQEILKDFETNYKEKDWNYKKWYYKEFVAKSEKWAENVKKLQEYLNKILKLEWNKKLEIDWQYWQKTYQAVLKYQNSKNIMADWRIWVETLWKLIEDLNFISKEK